MVEKGRLPHLLLCKGGHAAGVQFPGLLSQLFDECLVVQVLSEQRLLLLVLQRQLVKQLLALQELQLAAEHVRGRDARKLLVLQLWKALLILDRTQVEVAKLVADCDLVLRSGFEEDHLLLGPPLVYELTNEPNNLPSLFVLDEF